MRDLTTKFGSGAGKIWKALNETGSLKEEELKEKTQLNTDDFYGGIGWLARENKIAKHDEENLRLGATNLTSKIGDDAGRVWKILDIWGEVDIHSIKRLADIQEEDAHTALGWLAKEDKICVDKYLRFSLKSVSYTHLRAHET